MKTLILSVIGFLFYSEIELFFNSINIFRLLNNKEELFYSETLDTTNVKPFIVDDFDFDQYYLNDFDSCRIILKDNKYIVYLK